MLGTLQKVYKSYHISAKAWDFDCVPLLLACERRKVLCFQNTMMGTNRTHTPIFQQETKQEGWWILSTSTTLPDVLC